MSNEEHSLLEERELFEAIVLGSSDAIFSVDPSLFIRIWNPAAMRILGWKPQDVIGKSLQIIVPEQDKNFLPYLQNFEEYDEDHLESEFLHSSGFKIPVSITVSPLWKPNQDHPGYSFIVKDMREYIFIEKELSTLYAVFQSSHEAILSTDPTGNISSWNPAAEKLLGYSSLEILGKNFRDLIPKRERDQSSQILKKVKTENIHQTFETFKIHSDGHEVAVENTISIMRDKNGKHIGFSIILRDISEKKKSEMEHAILSALVEQSSEAICSLDNHGRITSWNKGCELLYGYEHDEVLQKKFSNFFPKESPILLNALLNGIQNTGHSSGLEFKQLRKDGTSFSIWATISIIKSVQNENMGFSLILRDISLQKQHEEDINTLASIVQNSEDAIFSIDIHQTIQNWNRGAQSIFGWTSEIIGSSVLKLVPFDLHKEWNSKWAQLLNEPKILNLDIRALHKDSHEIQTWVVISPLFAADGKLTGFSVIARDVTELFRKEQQLIEKAEDLERSNRDLEQFAHVSSHDLKEPLRRIINYSELLKEKYEQNLDEKGNRYLDVIWSSTQRMHNLVQDLLEFSKLAKTERKDTNVDLNNLVESVQSQLHILIKENSSQIEVQNNLPQVYANPSQIQQVFQNIITNAIKYHRAGIKPIIAITAKQTGGFVRIAIQDNGRGIPAKQSHRIFAIFQRLQHQNDVAGTGIGLSICKRIVEGHGGQIWVHSKEEKGSTFFFTLPSSSNSNQEEKD